MAKLHFRPYIPNQLVLFPQRIDENIADNDPVRIISAIVDNLNLESFHKLYKESGCCPYPPKDSFSQEEVARTKEEKATLRKVKKLVKELEKHRDKLNKYNQTLEQT